MTDYEDEYPDKPFGYTDWGEKIVIFFVTLAVMGMGLFYLWGVTGDSDQATKLLLEDGYEDITIGGGAVFGCGEGDWKRTTFKAKNQAGNYVQGIVCCGVAKGCTIRRK